MKRICDASIIMAILLLAASSPGQAQPENADNARLQTWWPYQLIPNILVYTSGAGTRMGLEWEAAPLLYSFGINRKTSPWYSFIVVPTARFSGSVELNVAGQLYSGPVGGSHVGHAAHLMVYLPLADKGELAGMNLGVGMYGSPDGYRLFNVVGASTAFGMLHLNVRHADRPATWVVSLDVRMY